MKIALLSDTHGLLRPDLFPYLEEVEHILHAGDVGPGAILIALEAMAPVTAVWGNTDGFEIRDRLVETAEVELAGAKIVVTHGHRLGYPTPARLAPLYPDASLIVFGHTHVPVIERVQVGEHEILAVNPGSCGPRRSDLLPTLALAEITPDGIEMNLVVLPDR